MKIRKQMIIILAVGNALTILVQTVASPRDTSVVFRLLAFEAIFGLPFAVVIYRVLTRGRP